MCLILCNDAVWKLLGSIHSPYLSHSWALPCSEVIKYFWWQLLLVSVTLQLSEAFPTMQEQLPDGLDLDHYLPFHHQGSLLTIRSSLPIRSSLRTRSSLPTIEQRADQEQPARQEQRTDQESGRNFINIFYQELNEKEHGRKQFLMLRYSNMFC